MGKLGFEIIDLIISISLDWICIITLINLITKCFEWNFSLQYATGFWLILLLIRYSTMSIIAKIK